jgi:lipid II:glycine glycyltransferase (peptidoglycan interpeptide bridge formation enzyme)
MAVVVEETRQDATPVVDEVEWDSFAEANGGHLLQSWKWGEFKARHGWSVERVLFFDGEHRAGAQILFKQGGPFSIAYIPRGPIVPPGEHACRDKLIAKIDEVCRSRRALNVILEPNDSLLLEQSGLHSQFASGPSHFQPARTVKVPLLTDDELLAQMHQKTRYSVRLAQRRGVVVDRTEFTPENIDLFYGLLMDTSERNEFGVHNRQYYADFLDIFSSHALMLIAKIDGYAGAGLVAARFGKEAIYMYGGSSTEHRAHGAAFLLQFEAMRWAREAGCTHYDLWGIPEEDPAPAIEHGDRISGTKGEDWRGLYRFKTGFGGEIVSYPPTLERRYRPILSRLVRRRYGNRV